MFSFIIILLKDYKNIKTIVFLLKHRKYIIHSIGNKKK